MHNSELHLSREHYRVFKRDQESLRSQGGADVLLARQFQGSWGPSLSRSTNSFQEFHFKFGVPVFQ